MDRHALITTIESRLTNLGCPSAFLLLVVLEDADGEAVTDADLVATIARHVSAMIRSTDLIATLDAGELGMVVFDLPPIQRVAFTDGINMAVNGVLDALAPGVGLRALLGTSPLRPDTPITAAFRQADRELRGGHDRVDPEHHTRDQLAASGPISVG
ncbi:MAG: hypothetical protein R2710_21975 [Acidimicrobiales bacterium]